MCQLPSLAIKRLTTKTFTHPSAGFTFQYPARAIITLGNAEIDSSTKDSVTVRWQGGFLAIQLIKTSLKKAIEQSGALELNDNGKYYRPGRFGIQGETKPIEYGALNGLYGISMCGISDANGFHAAAGSCLSAFLSDGKQTAYFETDGVFPCDCVNGEILPTFRFHK